MVIRDERDAERVEGPRRVACLASDDDPVTRIVGGVDDLQLEVAADTDELLTIVESEPIDCVVARANDEGDALAMFHAVRAFDEELPYVLVTESVDTGEYDELLAATDTDLVVSGTDGPPPDLRERVAELAGSDIDRESRGPVGIPEDAGEVLDRVSDSYMTVDQDWTVTYINETGAELVRRDQSEIIGNNYWDVFPNVEGTSFEEEYRYAMQEQEQITIRDFYAPLETWFEVRAYPTGSGLSFYYRDVSLEKARREARQLHKEVDRSLDATETLEDGLESVCESIVDYTDWEFAEAWVADEDGLTAVDAVAIDDIDVDAVVVDDVEGDSERLADDIGDDGPGLPGAVRDRTEPMWAREMDDETGPLAAELEGLYGVPVVHDESVVAVLTLGLNYRRSSEEALEDAAESVATELAELVRQRREEMERRRKERQFEAVFNDPTALTGLLDTEGRIVKVNERSRELAEEIDLDIIGTPYWEHPWYERTAIDKETVRERVERVLDGEFIRFESVIEDDIGDLQAVDTSLRPVRNQEGDVEGIIVESRDVSERHRLHEHLREERNLNQRILETSPAGIIVLDEDGDVDFLNERGAELLGGDEHSLESVPAARDEDGEVLPEEERLITRVSANGETVRNAEHLIHAADGEKRWLAIHGMPLDEGRGVFVFEDITDRREHLSALEELNEAVRRLPNAETREGVIERAVEAAYYVLGFDRVDVALYDDSTGRLELKEGVEQLESLLGGTDEPGPVWDAFIEETTVREETAEGDMLLVSLGEHGVFIAGGSDRLPDREAFLAELLASNLTTELDRAAREETLRERTDDLQERRRSLQQLNRINRVIRTLTGRLIRAETREEVEAAACECFADAEPYRLAWFGYHDAVNEEVVPTQSAGEADGYLEDLTIATGEDSDAEQGPCERAVRTRETQYVNDIYGSDAAESWRKEALRRDFRAAISVPVVYRDQLLGVLTVFATEPQLFEGMEVAVLGELGEIIGYALNAIERKKALIGDSSTEVDVALPAAGTAIGSLSSDIDEFELENLVRREDGLVHAFLRVGGVPVEELQSEIEWGESIQSATHISSEEGLHLLEAKMEPDAPLTLLVDRGVITEGIDVIGDEVVLTLRVPEGSKVSEVLNLLRDEFGEVELRTRREIDEPVRTAREFEADFRKRLTERQEEVLETAYAAGFFEWPRESTGQDVADLLDVSQPTVNRHIRSAQRALFDLIFEEDADDPPAE